MTASLVSSGTTKDGSKPFEFREISFYPAAGTHWKTQAEGLRRLDRAGRLVAIILHAAGNCVFSSIWTVGAVSNRTDAPNTVGAISESRRASTAQVLLETIKNKRNITQRKV